MEMKSLVDETINRNSSRIEKSNDVNISIVMDKYKEYFKSIEGSRARRNRSKGKTIEDEEERTYRLREDLCGLETVLCFQWHIFHLICNRWHQN